MNQVAKEMWIKALESGEYIQTHGPLRDQDESGKYRYCAIGVLLAVYCEVHGLGWSEVVEGYNCTQEFIDWVGCHPRKLMVTAGERTGYIPTLNDYFKIPFPLIAQAIREQV